MLDKKADLAGPGIGDYAELEKILPDDYYPLLDVRETQKALFAVKRYIEDNLCKELNLMMVQVPLIVDVESGVNDMLDRDGSRTPIQFRIQPTRLPHRTASVRPLPGASLLYSSHSGGKRPGESALSRSRYGSHERRSFSDQSRYWGIDERNLFSRTSTPSSSQ